AVGTPVAAFTATTMPGAISFEAHAGQGADNPILVSLRPAAPLDRKGIFQNLSDRDVHHRLSRITARNGRVAIGIDVGGGPPLDVAADQIVPRIPLVAVSLVLRRQRFQVQSGQPPGLASTKLITS